MQDGFLFDELSNFKKDLFRSINEKYPDETKKFIKKEAKKVALKAKDIANKQVNKKTGLYHKSFKSGKVYKYGENDTCCRAYNSAPHAHLIEYGHVQKGKINSFTPGKMIFKQAEIESITEFLDDCENFLTQFVDDTCRGKV